MKEREREEKIFIQEAVAEVYCEIKWWWGVFCGFNYWLG